MSTVIGLKVRPLGVFGAEVQDIDLARASAPDIDAIKRAWYRYDLLLFRKQRHGNQPGPEPGNPAYEIRAH